MRIVRGVVFGLFFLPFVVCAAPQPKAPELSYEWKASTTVFGSIMMALAEDKIDFVTEVIRNNSPAYRKNNTTERLYKKRFEDAAEFIEKSGVDNIYYAGYKKYPANLHEWGYLNKSEHGLMLIVLTMYTDKDRAYVLDMNFFTDPPSITDKLSRLDYKVDMPEKKVLNTKKK